MEQKTGSKSGKEYVKAYIVTLFFILYAEYIRYKFSNWTEVRGKVCAYTHTHTHTWDKGDAYEEISGSW